MMRQRPIVLALAALFNLPTGLALAAGEDGDQVLPEVRVKAAPDEEEKYRTDTATTATRTETPLRDVPQSVSVVKKELIRDQSAFNLRDALRNVSGLTIAAGEGGRTGDSITLRGFAANSDTYLDGVKENGQYVRDTFFLDRVEVLKGPSSVLFGRGATGGVVNAISRRADFATERELALSYGSFDNKRVTANLAGAAADNVALRLDALYQDSDSFRDFNFVERSGLAPNLGLKFGDSTQLHLQHLHQEEDSVFDYGVPMFRGRPADVDIETFYGFVDDRLQEYETDISTATLEQRFTPQFKLRNTLRYGEYQRDYRTHLFGTVTDSGDASTIARSQALRSSGQENLINQADFIYSGNLGNRENTLLFGAEVAREDFDFLSKTSTGVSAVSIFNPEISQTVGAGRANDLSGTLNSARITDTETLAFYMQDQLTLSAHWKLLGGVRYDQFEAEVNDRVANTQLAQDTDFVSPRAGLVYQPSPIQSYYASYAESFNPSAESFNLSVATAALDPEENRSFELGAKWDLFDAALTASGAVFRLEKTNARTADPSDPTRQILAGEQRTDGFELELAGDIGARFSLSAAYAYLDAEIVRSNTLQNGVPIEGKTPSNVPRHSGVVWGSYALAPAWSLGGGVFFASEKFTNNANTAELPSWERVDLALTYTQRAYDLQVSVFNVFDERYFESGQSSSALPGTPRSALATVRFKF